MNVINVFLCIATLLSDHEAQLTSNVQVSSCEFGLNLPSINRATLILNSLSVLLTFEIAVYKKFSCLISSGMFAARPLLESLKHNEP